ncbi:hemin uptake protein HemP [Desertibaculum subflavum]|uniref:hemin uptake protein HemP n=1 Tax=Desertibaculum subflavum TaxID=2268458 RepID=UPI0034D2ED3E
MERTGRRSLKVVKPAEAATAAPAGASRSAQRVTSSSLFQGGKLLLIEHAGSEYRLQITSRGKLILTR